MLGAGLSMGLALCRADTSANGGYLKHSTDTHTNYHDGKALTEADLGNWNIRVYLLPKYMLQDQWREPTSTPVEASIKVLIDFNNRTTKLWHFKGFFYGAYPVNKHHPFLSTGEPSTDLLTAHVYIIVAVRLHRRRGD